MYQITSTDISMIRTIQMYGSYKLRTVLSCFFEIIDRKIGWTVNENLFIIIVLWNFNYKSIKNKSLGSRVYH